MWAARRVWAVARRPVSEHTFGHANELLQALDELSDKYVRDSANQSRSGRTALTGLLAPGFSNGCF